MKDAGDTLLSDARIRLCRSSARSSLLPWYRTTGQQGSHFLNSFIQLGSVASGPAMRKGPAVLVARSCAMRPMVWMVLPSPISSARMPLRPFSHSESSHCTPSSW